MRNTVLGLLRGKQGEYVSGEDISRGLDVSRTAVWKHVQNLRQEGYVIDSNPRQGYRLISAPDQLWADEVIHGLRTKWLGRNVVHFSSIGSTNKEAKRLAAQEAVEGTVVVAESQTGGRGRLCRSWFSPGKGGIWFSVILRPKIHPTEAAKFTFLGAVAVAKAIREITGLQVEIKWPNDIHFKGRKLVGILTELSAEMDAINYIVMGIGINVNMDIEEFPVELQDVASTLKRETGSDISRRLLLQAILEELEQRYEEIRREGFATVFSTWRTMNCTLGFQVSVVTADQQFTGLAIDIDAEGALLVKKMDGLIERVLSGDVSIRRHYE